jgi:hypothetical protein
MTRERVVRAVAGTLVLTSIAMSLLVDARWLALAGFVGANLLQSAFTGFCPLEKVLTRAGVADGGSAPPRRSAGRL